jgi:outer membrane protein OmpA-like peptidoglycan-associated protein/opacity protein-like surface antigen
MRKRSLVAVSTFALLTASSLDAQRPVAVEGGLFGQFTKMDAELAMDDVFSIGARLGVYVLFNNFAVELDGQYGKTDWAAPAGNTSIDFLPWALRGVYGIPLGERLRLLIGAGYQQNIYKNRVQVFESGAVGANEYENSFTGLVGLKRCLNQQWSIRGDAVVDYNSSPNFNGSPITLDGVSTSWGIRVGVSRMFRGTCYDVPIVVPPPPPPAPPPPPPTPAPPPPPPPNTAPIASITSPSSGASFTGAANFAGTCQDPEQGDVSSSGRWRSSRDGDIGTGASFSRTLSPGTHTITMTCTDSQGLTGAISINVTSQELLVRLNWVHFNFNRSTLTQAGRDTLNRVIETLQQRADLRVSVEGHTDPYGSDEYNQGLSERRAQAVVTYLTRGGVAADRIVQKGFGEQCLVLDDDHTRPTRSQSDHRVDRRVEVWSVGDVGAATSCRPRQQ